MAKRDHTRPDPVLLVVGGKTLATAYARRPPGNRQGTEHWLWVASFKEPGTGRPVQRSLGRLPENEVGTELAAYFRGVNPAAITLDGTGLKTVDELLRAYFAHLEARQDTDDALAPRTLLFYEGSAKRLLDSVEEYPIDQMSEAWVMSVRASLLGSYSVRTVKADLKFLRQAIVWGRRQGLEIPDVSVRSAQKFKGRKAQAHINNHRTPTEEEVQRLYGSMRRSGTKLAMFLMWQTGCRVGEAGVLRWGNITRDRDGCWVRFPEGKTGPRVTPITAEAYAELLSYRPEHAKDSDRLFRKPAQVARNTGAAISVACQVQGRNIQPFTSHGLRRLFTDRCIRAKVDIATYADIAGHSIETALKHYRTVTVDDRLAALHRLTSGSSADLLTWVARNGVSEEEAIRVLTMWRSSNGQRTVPPNKEPASAPH